MSHPLNQLGFSHGREDEKQKGDRWTHNLHPQSEQWTEHLTMGARGFDDRAPDFSRKCATCPEFPGPLQRKGIPHVTRYHSLIELSSAAWSSQKIRREHPCSTQHHKEHAETATSKWLIGQVSQTCYFLPSLVYCYSWKTSQTVYVQLQCYA